MSNLLKGVTHSTDQTSTVIPVCNPVVRVVEANDEGEYTPESLLQLRVQTLAEIKQWKEHAEQECKDMVLRAESRVAEIEQQAFEVGHGKGYEAGVKEARDAAEHECSRLVLNAQSVVDRAVLERRRILLGTHRVLSEVALEITRRLLERELTVDGANIEKLVGDLLVYVAESNRVEVRVNPADYERATDAHPAWKHARFGEWDLVVIPDPRIEQGGCEVRSDSGRVDATIETKLELLQRTISEVMERSVDEYVSDLD